MIYTVTIATYNGGGDGPSVSETVQTIGECEYTSVQDDLVCDVIEELVLYYFLAFFVIHVAIPSLSKFCALSFLHKKNHDNSV